MRVGTRLVAVGIDAGAVLEEGLLAGGLVAAELRVRGVAEVLAVGAGITDAETLQEDDAGIEERLGEDAVDDVLLVIEVVVQVDAVGGTVEQADLIFDSVVQQGAEDLIADVAVRHEVGRVTSLRPDDIGVSLQAFQTER